MQKLTNRTVPVVTPCLTDNISGDIVETEVVQIRRKSFLEKFNKRNHWYTNWKKLADEAEIFALVIKGTVDIQGLVSIQKNDDVGALYIPWMVSAPINNKLLNTNIKYKGIGGHLFAIAVNKSIEYGYNGYIYGFAANAKLLQHYVECFDAEPIRVFHPYHFAIDDENGKKITEIYDYEWTDDIL